jgi:hypothetical protein
MTTETTPTADAGGSQVERGVRPHGGDIAETLAQALRRAYHLGQTYWQQADSESYAQNRRSEETQRKFDALVDEVRGALERGARLPLTDEQLWRNDEIMSLNADLGWNMETIRMFVAAVERAHGIRGA